jgi:tetratricopeptide (TPR) repeat protein
VRPRDAESLYRRALSILEPFGDVHILTRITIYGNLGTLLAAICSDADADVMFCNSLVALERIGNGDSKTAAIVHANRAMTLIKLSRLDDAETALREALVRFERVSPTGRDVERVLDMLGNLLGSVGRADEARQCLERAKRLHLQ